MLTGTNLNIVYDSKAASGSAQLTLKIVLTYIRHRKFPLFWHKESGFDYGRYSRLAAQADFFGVDRLKSWISVENYKGAIECRKSIGTIPMEEAFDGDTMGISPEIKVISTHWTTKKQYVCPRNIAPHMGRPKYCGRACSNALGNNKPEFRDKPIMTAVVEEEQIAFKLDQLTDGGD